LPVPTYRLFDSQVGRGGTGGGLLDAHPSLTGKPGAPRSGSEGRQFGATEKDARVRSGLHHLRARHGSDGQEKDGKQGGLQRDLLPGDIAGCFIACAAQVSVKASGLL